VLFLFDNRPYHYKVYNKGKEKQCPLVSNYPGLRKRYAEAAINIAYKLGLF